MDGKNRWKIDGKKRWKVRIEPLEANRGWSFSASAEEKKCESDLLKVPTAGMITGIAPAACWPFLTEDILAALWAQAPLCQDIYVPMSFLLTSAS